MKIRHIQLLIAVLAGAILTSVSVVYAINITVPSSPVGQSGWLLQSTITGAYQVAQLFAGTNITIATTSNSITISATGGSSAFPFTPTTNYGALTNATSTPLWFQNGLFASSTSYIDTLNLTNALTIGNGGTGLTAVGASSTVLTTNGSVAQWNKLATSQLTNDSNFITLGSLSGTYPIIYNNSTGAISSGFGTSTTIGVGTDKLLSVNGSGVIVASSTIGNGQLINNSIIVTTASPLGGAATVPLGGTLALTCTGCLTANQSITLSGAVTGTGATAITTAFGTMAQGVLTNAASSATIPTPQATSTLYGTGVGGQVLGWNNTTGGLAFVATSTIANLTATDSTLTFSGTYNGSTARTIGLNLGNANIWTAGQAFSYTATTTFSKDIMSGGLIAGNYLYASSTTATSTFAGGVSVLNFAQTGTATTTLNGGLTLQGRNVYAAFDKSFGGLGSTTPDANFNQFNTATSTFLIWNPSQAVTATVLFCKTDNAGNVTAEMGNGTASTTVVATSAGVSTGSTVTWTARQNVMFSLKTGSGTPNVVSCTGTFYNQ